MKQIALILVFLSKFLHGGLLPDYDDHVDSMSFQRIGIESMEAIYLANQKNVPRIIHQIWFGQMPENIKNKINEWKKYTSYKKYRHILWDEKSLIDAQKFSMKANLDWISFFIESKNYWAAADILRMEILNRFGGIYVDCDFSPPQINDEFIDFSKFIRNKGLTCLTEDHGRNIGNAALFVCNGFISTSPDHPVIFQMVNQINGNIKSFYQKEGTYDAMYITGPFLLNSILNGNLQIIPWKYAKELKMIE